MMKMRRWTMGFIVFLEGLLVFGYAVYLTYYGVRVYENNRCRTSAVASRGVGRSSGSCQVIRRRIRRPRYCLSRCGLWLACRQRLPVVEEIVLRGKTSRFAGPSESIRQPARRRRRRLPGQRQCHLDSGRCRRRTCHSYYGLRLEGLVDGWLMVIKGNLGRQ